MTQYQQVLAAVQKIGGRGILDEIYKAIDAINEWGAKNKKASVSRYLSKSNEFRRVGHIWIYDDNDKEILLHCSDGVLATAIAKFSKKKWTILGISEVHGFGNAAFEKVLFDMTFDDLIPFNSMSGVSYVAVKKDNLWGLIRFRLNPEFAVDKEFFRKAIGNEPIDEKVMDPIGREIKLIEEIKYPDISIFIEKYHLEKLNFLYDDDKFNNSIPEDEIEFEEDEPIEKSNELREWSDELKEYTKDALSNLEFGCDLKGNVRMKRNDGSFGYILFKDAFSNKYNVHHDDYDVIDSYKNVSDMIEDGWVLD